MRKFKHRRPNHLQAPSHSVVRWTKKFKREKKNIKIVTSTFFLAISVVALARQRAAISGNLSEYKNPRILTAMRRKIELKSVEWTNTEIKYISYTECRAYNTIHALAYYREASRRYNTNKCFFKYRCKRFVTFGLTEEL